MQLPVLLLTLALAPVASAERSRPVELGEFDAALHGHRTTILVLGTAHLSGWKGDVPRARLDEMLAPLLQRLVDFAPDTNQYWTGHI